MDTSDTRMENPSAGTDRAGWMKLRPGKGNPGCDTHAAASGTEGRAGDPGSGELRAELERMRVALEEKERTIRMQEGVIENLNNDLNNYFRSSDIGKIFLDEALNVRTFNPAATRLVLLGAGDIGRPFEEIAPGIPYERIMDDIRSVYAHTTVVEHEVLLRDGRTYLLRILPYLKNERTLGGVIIAVVDVSVLKNLNSIVNSVFNASLNAIMSLQAIRNEDGEIEDFVFTAANYASDRLFSLPSGTTGMRTSKVFPKLLEGTLFKKLCDAVNCGQQVHKEFSMEQEDGEAWFDLAAVKMMDGLIVTLHDISRQKALEAQLRLNYNRIFEEKNFLAESMPLIVWTASPDGSVDFLNQQFSAFSGRPLHEGLKKGWMEMLHPDDVDGLREKWLHAIRTKTDFSIDLRLQRQDASYRWHLLRARAKQDETGEILMWVGTITDIHEQRMITEIMEQQVALRTRELHEVNRELEESNNDLLQFASVASHDLKEPLRKILMFSSMVKDSLLEADHPALSYVNRIVSSSERMTKLINDLLNYSRLSISRWFEPTDLNQVIHEILADFELAIQEKDAVIEIDPLPVIDAIPGQIRQVFQNIIGNALKFSGGQNLQPMIRIRAELTATCSFTAPAVPGGKFCRIMVIDNGVGFEQQYVGKIFTIFQRLHSKTEYEGTGIGLAIAKRIIDKHSGIITASSETGKGATFMLVLPLRQDSMKNPGVSGADRV